MNTNEKSPREKRNELLAETLVKNLERRHYEASFCKTREEAVEKIIGMISEGASVAWGGSMTIRNMGLTARLKSGGYKVYDRDDVTTQEDKMRIYRKAFECDYYISSVNAISEDGVIVNIDGNGNRVAAITWGPEHVILVIGLNKVCRDVDAAVKRARSEAAPLNMARFSLNTPCRKDGTCHNCLSPDSICNYISIQRMSHPAKHHIVVLVDDVLGY